MQVIDIRSKITNSLPVVQITDDLTVTVNNRKSVILSMQVMIDEREKKEEKGATQSNEIEFMNRALAMLIGQNAVDSIEKIDLPLPEYKEVFQSIMSAAMGTYEEDTPSGK